MTQHLKQPDHKSLSFHSGVIHQQSRQPTRIGAVSYLNTKPLIFGLENALCEGDSMGLALPSKLAVDLEAGLIDVGLIPVVEYFRHSEFEIVSNAVIACKGPVWSVRVFFRCDPSRVQTLALDEGSRTSAALIKVLFHQKFGFIPKTVPLRMEDDPMTAPADAVLVIGDRAMHPESFQPAFESDWDLGQSWFEETGLPFVFAMWVARNRSFATASWAEAFERARDEGLLHVREIAQATADKYRLTASRCEDYLTNYIRFFLNSDERKGLQEFRRRCDELGLTSQ